MNLSKLYCLMVVFICASPLFAFKDDAEVTEDERKQLHLAVAVDNVDEVTRLVKKENISPNTPDNTDLREMPLHHAQSAAMVSVLIRLGADPNGLDANGGTPLHTAVFAFENEVAEQLLNLRAHHLVRDNQGHFPWHLTTDECPTELRNRLFVGVVLVEAEVRAQVVETVPVQVQEPSNELRRLRRPGLSAPVLGRDQDAALALPRPANSAPRLQLSPRPVRPTSSPIAPPVTPQDTSDPKDEVALSLMRSFGL